MVKKIWQSLFLVLGLSLIAVFQLAAISNWPPFFNQLNAVLITLVFTLFFLGFRAALWGVLISGLWLDLFSFNFFGLYLITFFLVIIAAERISLKLLTNRSFYSFWLLLLVATVVDQVVINLLRYFSADLSAVFFLSQKSFWLALLYQGIWATILAALLFNLSALMTKRLQPFFLEKKAIV
jgi:cell shape-determining protein MreD